MLRDRNRNQLLVPQSAQALEQLKFEIAQELGIQFSRDGYHGDLLTKDAGRIGGNITRRLVQMAEQKISSQLP